ncbi:MAG: sigma-54 dependent transcriptional regulator [Acidobacteriota bacterium]|nr:sigma-54 dependent transcriptional regulator [Acidobacteriota bacterium]
MPPLDVIFGSTPAMQTVRAKLAQAAATNIPVLIRGASGTGKEIVAKLIHRNSPWGNGPFVKVNCPAIPGTLMESELFGHEKGSFTGAYNRKSGRFASADKGTLFLDEIGDLEANLQAKLLQVLQDGKFSRIGGEHEESAEVRVISATNHYLEEDMGTGAFRQDLYYRLDGISITLPSLAERREDIPHLAEYFVQHYNAAFSRRTPSFSPQGVKKLMDCQWHGNIRELENVIRRYVIFGQEDASLADIKHHDTLTYVPEISLEGDISLKQITRRAVRELEYKVISRVLLEHHGNRTMAAKALKISYRALMYKIRDSGIPRLRNISPKQAIAVPEEEVPDA